MRFNQTYDIYYQQTFTLAEKMNTIRILLSLASNFNWLLWLFDVKNIFPHHDLEEGVWIDTPPGLGDKS